VTRYPIARSIARRELEFHDANRRIHRVTVRVGQPRRAGNDWVCPYEILGMPRARRRWAFGIDAVQALGLAFHVIAVDLQALAKGAGGGQFWFLGERGMTFPDGCSIILEAETQRALRATGIRPRWKPPARKRRGRTHETRPRTMG
jgi:hypothetical protein